jgi:hypothetical protein
MTSKELERYDWLIDEGLQRPLTASEERELNKLGKKSVEARKRNKQNT